MKKTKEFIKHSDARKIINNGFIISLSIITIIWVWKLRTFPFLQIRTLVIAALVYLIWAYAHHYFDKSLTVGVYMEYLLTALLALVLMLGVMI